MTSDPPPAVNEARIGPGDVLEYYNGTTWVKYEDPPSALSAPDPEPQWLVKEIEVDDDGDVS
jgi:hypothetical protein